MKIAIINTNLKMGGIRQSLLNLLDALKEKGFEIDLYILTGCVEEIQKQIAGLNINSVTVIPATDIYYKTINDQHTVWGKIRKLLLGTTSRMIGREKVLKFIINEEKLPEKEYDVVISYSNSIWTRGSRYFSGGCEYVAFRLNGKRKLAWVHSNPKNLGFTSEIGQRIYARFDKIINVSYGCKEIFDSICSDLENKSIVLYNLCNSNKVRYLMNEENPYQNGFHIVTVARLDNKSKRLDRLAMSCKLLKEAGYSFQWHVVGDGNDMPLLRKLVHEYQLHNVLIIEGRKENPYPYMKNADLYVCTSAYEAFPMVIRESFLCGTPVITTPIPPAKEVITECKNGLICAGFEPDNIYEEIVKIFVDGKLLEDMKTFISDNDGIYADDISPFINTFRGEIEC